MKFKYNNYFIFKFERGSGDKEKIKGFMFFLQF